MSISPPSAQEQQCIDELRKKFPASQLNPEDSDFLDGNTYLRFARARDGNVEKASAMLEAALAWRKEYKPYAITEADVQTAMKQMTMNCGGTCKLGRPIIIMTLGVPNECSVEDRTRQLIYILEITQKRHYDSITWIIDFGEMGKSKKDSRSREARKATMKVMQDNYPERLGSMILYHPPWYVRMLIGVVKAFMDARTAEKIYMGGSKLEDLEKFASADQLPAFMGGSMKAGSIANLEGLPVIDGVTATN